ncbi:uncharacterized protein ACR2FA_008010 [Aphomia sociella]
MDSMSQKGIQISDYCPKMKYCEEGAHVMCMYYNPDKIMGPRCSRPKNVSITPELANKLLEVSNAVRSKIALGKEKGKGGDYLPRGYGVFRLQWDNELATFAQVLANQCVLRHDMCRATKKFSDPGQTAGLVRFSYPDWFPVSKAGHFTKPGLSPSKLLYAITQTLKSWYGQKGAVTANMITSYPDWTLKPNSQGGRLYLEMIYGPATHMGCGVSAYTEYAYYDNNAALNYNSVQVICNYSARPHKGGSVYNITPPAASGFTIRCGCPVGSDEDADCLCYDKPKRGLPPPKIKTCSKKDLNCNPSVVLLPIFTVEDAPSEKIIDAQENEDIMEPQEDSMDIFNFEESGYNNISTKEPPVHELLNEITKTRPNLKHTGRASNKVISVKNRYFPKKSIVPEHQYLRQQSTRPVLGHVANKKSSIFLRTNIFESPVIKKKKSMEILRDIKKDVAPRKDFSKVKNLLKIYMKDKQNKVRVTSAQKTRLIPEKNNESILTQATTESFLNTAEEKVINYDHYLKENFHSNISNEAPPPKELNIKNSQEDGDKKLMNLLDKLEQEIKHIELHGDKKEMFDAKIRKIYYTVVRKPIDLISNHLNILESVTVSTPDYEAADHILKHEISYDKEIIKNNKDNKMYKDVEENETRVVNSKLKIHDHLNKVENNLRPISRTLSRNSLISNHNQDNRDHRNLRKENGYDIPSKHSEDIRRDNQIHNDIEEINRHRYNDKDGIRSVYSKFDKNTNHLYKDENLQNGDNNVIDDVLGPERRQYYQDKLDNLARKLQHTRNYRHRNVDNDHYIRRMRPTNHDNMHTRRSRTQIEPLYVPDRARFLHGF